MGNRVTTLACALLASSILGNSRATAADLEPRPDLVAAREAFAPTEEERKGGAVVLWHDHEVVVDERGLESVATDLALVVLDDQAASDYAEFVVPYNAHYGDVRVEVARVVAPDGTVKPVQADAVQEKTPASASQYDDMRFRAFALPRLTPGSAIELRVVETAKEPVIVGEWSRTPRLHFVHWKPGSSKPRVDRVRSARVVLRVPHGGAVRHAALNVDASPTIEKGEAADRYLWQVGGLPALPVESRSPSVWNRVAKIALTSMADWGVVDRWFAPLLATAAEPTDAIRERAAALVREANTPRARIDAIFDFMKREVRYIQADVARGGFTPHRAEEVLRNGYGDCKDQAALLVALLRAAGIDARAALVNNFGGADLLPDLPSPFAFDHAIVQVATPDGPIWLDSSPASARSGEIDWTIQDRWALVVDGAGGRLVRTPVLGPDHNVGTIAVDFRFENDELKGLLTVSTTGTVGSRLKSAFGKEADRNKYMEQVVRMMYPLAKVGEVAFVGLEDPRAPFRGTVRFTLAEAWNPGLRAMNFGGSALPLLSLFGGLSSLEEPETRRTDFVVGPPQRLVLETRCPSPYAQSDTVVGSGAGSFEEGGVSFRKEYVRDGSVTLARVEVVLSRSVVPLDQYASFHAALRKLLERSSWSVRFDRRDLSGEPLGEVALLERAFPGGRVALPEWTVANEVLEPSNGRITLRHPKGLGLVGVGWSVGDLSDSADIIVDIVAPMIGAQRGRDGATTVGGKQARWFEMRSDDGAGCVTVWSCEPNRATYLVTFVVRPEAEARAFHDRIVAGVRCEPVEAASDAPIFPVFDPPAGFEKEQDEFALSWVDASGNNALYAFPSGFKGVEMFDQLPAAPIAVEKVLEMLGNEAGLEVRLETGPERRGDRLFWTASVRGDIAVPSKFVLSAWYCPGPDVTFLGAYFGPTAGLEKAVERLLAARCP